MDSLGILHCSSSKFHFNQPSHLSRPALLNPNFLIPFCKSNRTHSSLVSSVSSTQIKEEGKKMNKRKSKSGSENARISIRLDHQVEFGEHVVILGSTKELGSWKKNVPMAWTENGWVCNLELKGGEEVEFKFVIVGKDKKNVVWEGGDNRVLNIPEGGSFGMVCKWNVTGEALELLPFSGEKDEEKIEVGDENRSVSTSMIVSEVETSPFVGQWQGKEISFMQSNEHGHRETERRWDSSGLEGMALKLVEGDRNARNWSRKMNGLCTS